MVHCEVITICKYLHISYGTKIQMNAYHTLQVLGSRFARKHCNWVIAASNNVHISTFIRMFTREDNNFILKLSKKGIISLREEQNGRHWLNIEMEPTESKENLGCYTISWSHIVGSMCVRTTLKCLVERFVIPILTELSLQSCDFHNIIHEQQSKQIIELDRYIIIEKLIDTLPDEYLCEETKKPIKECYKVQIKYYKII